MLEAIGAATAAKVEGSEKKLNWARIWQQSHECKKVTKEIAQICRERRATEAPDILKDCREYAMPLSTQIIAVTKRTFTAYWRDPNYLLGKY